MPSREIGIRPSPRRQAQTTVRDAIVAPKRSEYLASKLIEFIESNELPDGRLPTVRALVKVFRTSSVTMIEALKLLEKREVIEQRNRRREYVVAGTAEPDLAPLVRQPAAPLHEELAERIRDDVLTRTIVDGRLLLSLKEMCNLYGCHSRTLLSALSILESQGLIERWGRRYRVRYAVAGSRPSARTYIAGIPKVIQAFHHNIFSCVNAVERQLERIGWGDLQFVLADDPGRGTEFKAHTAAGLIYVAYNPSPEWYRFLSSQHMVPIAVIDPSSAARIESIKGHRRLLHIRSDQVAAGTQIGSLLAAHGHRHVAFVSHVERNSDWVGSRIRGLGQLYAEDTAGPYRLTVAGPPGGKRGGDEEVVRLSKAVGSAYGAARGLSGDLCGDIIDDYLTNAFNLSTAAANSRLMRPVFESLLGDPSITAWVCANDELAALAHHFLRRNGKRISQDLSLVGFDNAPLAARMGIATYDFGYDRMGNMAVHWLADPGSVTPNRRKTITHIGTVLVRSSVGGARK